MFTALRHAIRKLRAKYIWELTVAAAAVKCCLFAMFFPPPLSVIAIGGEVIVTTLAGSHLIRMDHVDHAPYGVAISTLG